jgi:hypothetical protein
MKCMKHNTSIHGMVFIMEDNLSQNATEITMKPHWHCIKLSTGMFTL